MKPVRPQQGYTLVEILVAMSVSVVLLAGVLSFYLQNLKSMYVSDQRTKLAAQIKKFSDELILQASRSNVFMLYKSAAPADFDGDPVTPPAEPVDRQKIDETDPLNLLHPAGDFAVFVYYEIPKPAAQPKHRITKIEGYFLTTTTAGGTGTLQKVIVDLSSSPSTDTVEAILTNNWNTTNAKFSTFFPVARGLAAPEVIDGVAVPSTVTPAPRLFYMSAAKNVIVSGQIFSSASNTDTNDWKTATNSFFFNITPRT